MGSRARYGSVSQKGGHLHSRVEAAAETGGRLLRLPLFERGAARAAPAAVLESRNGCRRGGAGFRGGIKKVGRLAPRAISATYAAVGSCPRNQKSRLRARSLELPALHGRGRGPLKTLRLDQRSPAGLRRPGA